MSARADVWTIERAQPAQQEEDIRRALLGMDAELRRLYGAPHLIEDHGLAHAWVVAMNALWPAGSKAGGAR